MSAEIPAQWTHSVKLSETAKGVRIDVHVYANNAPSAITEALETYLNTRIACKENHIPLAPMEVNNSKDE